MPGLKSPPPLPRGPVPTAARPHASRSNGHGSADPRQELLARAEQLNTRARETAEAGDLETSARLILQALDCERRAGGLGPQVLQLIKPRGS